MNPGLPRIQIGPLSMDPAESVSVVNRSFIKGLEGVYSFVPYCDSRSYGSTRQARLNVVNSLYLFKHLGLWLRCLRQYRPQVAHYALNSGWALEKSLLFLNLARRSGARTLGHLHSGSFLDFWKGLPPWRRQRAFHQLARLDAIIVLSERWRQAVIEQVGLPPSKLFVVNNPIHPEFEKQALAMAVDRPDPAILGLGILGRDKGVLDLVEAARLLPPEVKFQLRLAGPEREPGIRQRVQEFLTRHSLTPAVVLQESVWGQEKVRLFAETSISVLPSYYENFPLVVLEAAAAGHAIVTTPVGATAEFFQDGVSALFVTPGKPEQLAQALTRLLQDPKERGRLGRAAREVFCHRLARSKIMDSLHQIYQHLLSPSH